MNTCRAIAFFALASWSAVPSLAEENINGVSPGGADRILLESRCPTFSWTAVPGAAGYELVVYEVSEANLSAGASLVSSTVLPGGALSWTPSRSQCLAAGGTYAWTVRATDKAGVGVWSTERLFRTEAVLAREEVGEALEIVEEFLAGGGSLGELRGEFTRAGRGEAPEGEDRAKPKSKTRTKSLEPAERDRVAGLFAPPPVLMTPRPFNHLGLSSEFAGTTNATAVAVRGAGDLGGEAIAGYLGIAVGNLGGDHFDGHPQLEPLDNHEIGVLGFSFGGSSDNEGVVGVSENGSGGRFFQVDELGNSTNSVRLATLTHAIDAEGPVRIQGDLTADSLTLSCASGAYPIAAWCVGPEETAMNYRNARGNCWDQGKKLCPLDAILACDVQEPAGADCGVRTDDPTTEQWIWCAEVEDDTNNDINPFATPTLAKARAFASVGNNEINEIDWLDQDLEYVSYCCSER